MLDDLLKKLWNIKDRKRKLSETLKEVNVQQEYIEQMVINSIRGEGIQKVTSKVWGTASVKLEYFPVIKDWPSTIRYILASGNIELLKKEVNRAVWRENFKEKRLILPGVEEFEKDVIHFHRGKGENVSSDEEVI